MDMGKPPVQSKPFDIWAIHMCRECEKYFRISEIVRMHELLPGNDHWTDYLMCKLCYNAEVALDHQPQISFVNEDEGA